MKITKEQACKKSNVSLRSMKEHIYDNEVVYTFREWKMYNPFLSINKQEKKGEIVIFVPAYLYQSNVIEY